MPSFSKGMRGSEKYAWDKIKGKTVDLQEAIGQQRTTYQQPQTLQGMINKKFNNASPTMLARRFHSGNFNMVNRRRRAQPRQVDGPPRLSHRNTQPNRGTFGIGQGINR